MSPTTPFSTLARAMTRGLLPGDLLQELHRELLAATAAERSVVLEGGPGGSYGPSSGRGFATLQALSLSDDDARALDELVARGPGIRPLAALPRLAAELGETGLVVPIPLARRPTVLIAAKPRVRDDAALEAGLRAAVEFGIVLEWTRLSLESTFHHRLRELSLVFARSVTSIASLAPALEIVAHEADTLLGTRRTTIWLHDRKARELVLTASSDPAAAAAGTRVAVDSPAPAARGLRLERPTASGSGAHRTLIAPLKGWRRAQGTLVLEGAAAAIADDELIELGHELARQLAAGIENAQLLDEVIRGRRLLEDSFNSLADLVLVTDAALRVVRANDACCARLNRGQDGVVGRDLADVLGPAIAAWAAGGAVAPAVFEGPPLPGIFSITAVPLLTDADERAGRVVVCREITDQTRLERERAALGARLAQSEKLAALGQFVAGIAHEMNNPLQGILGHLELLIDHSEQARPIRTDLRRIFREAERANRIVRNLLVFTGSRRMTRRRLRLDRLLTRAIASRRVALERAGIAVVRDFDEAVPAVTGDPLLLQQAFLNILINAEHAIDAAGRPDGEIRVTTRTGAGGRAVAAIADTGTGIPPDVMPRLFDPFFTTKAVGKGTGLGLAITYGIVQEHEGTIEASNAPGGGAVFTIALPAGAEVM